MQPSMARRLSKAPKANKRENQQNQREAEMIQEKIKAVMGMNYKKAENENRPKNPGEQFNSD